MPQPIPPLHTLRAFEAVARLRSFTRAADELCLTHSAVSHQIRALESFFGCRLLERTSRSVTLTLAGQQFAEVVQDVLMRLQEATRTIANAGKEKLVVGVLPSFASRWLLRRLGDFVQTQPQIDLQISSTNTLQDLNAAGIDVAIRYGKGDWPNVHSEHLADETVFPVAAPSYLKRMKIGRASDLPQGTLLQDDFQPWDAWLARAGVPASTCSFGATFGDASLPLQAAELGQGIALGRSWLVQDALEAGTLKRIGRIRVPATGSYYLAFPKRRERSPQTAAFCEWMRQRCAQCPSHEYGMP